MEDYWLPEDEMSGEPAVAAEAGFFRPVALEVGSRPSRCDRMEVQALLMARREVRRAAEHTSRTWSEPAGQENRAFGWRPVGDDPLDLPRAGTAGVTLKSSEIEPC
jgi:hypothetical protein